jgi:adenylate cyclase
MHFRIGVNLRDVIEQEDGTIYGDGVNIAARMGALAEDDGVCVSSTVFDTGEGKLALGFDFLGDQQVKNIAKPVRVYRVRTERRPETAAPKAARLRKWRWPALAGLVLLGAITADGCLDVEYTVPHHLLDAHLEQESGGRGTGASAFGRARG